MFKYWRSRTGPLRFSFQLGKKVRRKKRQGGRKKKGKAKPGSPFIHAGAIKPGGEVGSSTSSIFFSPLNWVFVVIFNWTLQKPNCWVCLNSVYFCCTIKTASHLHLLDYTEISDYWTGRKSSNCEVSSCSFFFPSLPPKEWAENFRGKRKRKKPFESFFPVEGFFF